MTVKDLRVLIDNLDEYVHIPGGISRLKKSVLHLAVSGQLIPQHDSKATGEMLYQHIEKLRSEQSKNRTRSSSKALKALSINDVPYEIPSTWKWVRLGNIVDLVSGADLVPNKYNSLHKGIPYITGASNIENEQVIVSRWTEDPKNIACRGDLLITCKGTIGTMAFLSEDEAHIARQIMAIRFNKFLSPKFIKYTISTNISSLQEAAQSIIPGIARKDMLEMPIALPPLEEQIQITDKIEDIFALIDELSVRYESEQGERKKLIDSTLASLVKGKSVSALDLLDDLIQTKQDAVQLKKTINMLAVRGKLVPQDTKDGDVGDLLNIIQAKQDNRAVIASNADGDFQIPRSWRWVNLSFVTRMQNGFAFKSSQWQESGIPIVRIQNLNNHSSPFNYVKESDVEEKYLINDGQVLLSWSGTPGTSFGVFIWNRGKAALNQHIFKCEITSVDNEYFQIAANQAIYNKLDSAHGGVGLKHLTKSQLNALSFPLPPLAEQRRIVEKVSQLSALVDKFELALLDTPITTKSLAISAKKELFASQTIQENAEELTNQQKKVQRKMLACFIANESLDGKQFGKTKFEKLLHLIEYHVLKKNLNQKYSVQPAGPYDGAFTKLFWDDVVKSKWYRFEGYGNLQKIVAGDNHDKSQKDYGYLSNDEKARIRDLLASFKNWGYGEAEIISTLYAAWNNRLINGEEVSDGLLKQDFLQWDPQKTQYSDRLDKALSWMRTNNLIPDGWGNEIKRAKSQTKSINQ